MKVDVVHRVRRVASKHCDSGMFAFVLVVLVVRVVLVVVLLVMFMLVLLFVQSVESVGGRNKRVCVTICYCRRGLVVWEKSVVAHYCPCHSRVYDAQSSN